MAPSEVFNEAKWQAESDARTLAEANEIKVDQPRLDKAKTAAMNLVDKKQNELTGLKKVASIGSTGAPTANPVGSKKYFVPGGGIRVDKK